MIQILKLGLSGSETTLTSESRINTQGADTPYYNESRSVNKTLHVDFIATKHNWSISWDVISKANYDIINAIVALQYSSGTFLSYIETDSDGIESTYTVRVTVSSLGTLVQTGDYYYSGFGLTLEEV